MKQRIRIYFTCIMAMFFMACSGDNNNSNNQIVVPDDAIAPVITLAGDTEITLEVGGEYVDPGFEATDDVDGDISADVIVGGQTVDTDIEGSYTITYNVTDSAGNPANEVTRRIIVGALPVAGNPDGNYTVPAEAGPEDISNPDHVIGAGTPESCTAESFIDAVAQGGTIVFDCGPHPVTLMLPRPAKVVNDANPDIVIDGEGLITLSGGGSTRILYMNTCDPDQTLTTTHCDNQDHPRLTVQNITFSDGDSTSEAEYDGGGAIWVRGGRFKAVGCRFFNNVCASTGPDVGGAAIRVFSQYDHQPVYIVNSTFGGAEGYGNVGSNGGAISSIGVSWTIINTLFSHNRAVGNGANPPQPGTPGGGSGGAIYNDGNTMTLSVLGTLIELNEVNAHGSAIFFVSNDHSGDIVIDQSTIRDNSGGSWYPTYPGISNHDDTPIVVTDSTIN